MLRTNARYSAVIFGLLACAGSARGGLSGMYVDTSLYNIAQISYEDGVFESDRHFDTRATLLTPETGFGHVRAADFLSGVAFGQQSAMARSDVDLKTASDGFEFTTSMSSEAMLGKSGLRSSGRVETNINIGTTFDTDTEVEIFFRIDFKNTGFAGQFAVIEVYGAGIDNPDFRTLAVSNPLADGYVEVGFRSTALANETFIVSAELLSMVDTEAGFDTIRLGEMTVSVELRAVPSPAGTLVLGGFGVLALGRRRQ
ncbi:MAG: hypothetical protein JKY96_08885 [Phycisphaerales bacterium]|nr:hypothetical protein [Phycisphaerales bacterium]